jgi:hypothetical protein
MRNLFYYFPVIWRDRDYDWSYLADLLERKLRRSARYFSDDAYINKEMRVCLRLIERIQKDPYGDIADRRCQGRYGVKPRSGIENGRWVSRWPSDEHRRYWLKCHEDAEKINQLDCDRLFGLMAKYLRGWWD